MARHHYSTRAVLVLEQPWNLDSGDCNRSSVLPFIEGIAKLAGDTEVFHANFYDKRSFEQALEVLCSARFKNAVIYIAAHGNKKQIGGIRLAALLTAIGEHSKKTNITGIMLGSCFIGSDTYKIEAFIEGTNISWCAGYASESYWLQGTMIDSSILASMLELDENYLSERSVMIRHLGNALAPFSRTYIIGKDEDKNEVSLENSMRFIIQPRGQGNRARHVTDEVLKQHDRYQIAEPNEV
ncbi:MULTISPECIES: hypothetical protein [unclassified Pseudomonas]|uniref:hypothetical protein n=1 Tax=unclassified Pseudomonas TaxID=196821 RepID=UPI000ED7561C|nr:MULTISPECIES: hypothetical protein [unclassified Pseudomonas]HBZ92499.1 hypothetical protein [Pseudomonas sp.]